MRLLASALLACLTLTACADDAGRDGRAAAGASARPGAAASGSREALPADAAAALDRANAEFRAGRYESALAAYRGAAVHAPDHPAPHYGMYMVARAMKNAPLADSAMAAIRARTPAEGLTDSALARVHSGEGAPAAGGSLPRRHPAVAPKSLPPGHPPPWPAAPPSTAPRSGS